MSSRRSVSTTRCCAPLPPAGAGGTGQLCGGGRRRAAALRPVRTASPPKHPLCGRDPRLERDRKLDRPCVRLCFCEKHGLALIVDAAQTAGARPIDVQALGVDVLCFTGHKALLGPQGTGGCMFGPASPSVPLWWVAAASIASMRSHPSQMPTALEAGTLNVPGLAGLGAGWSGSCRRASRLCTKRSWP